MKKGSTDDAIFFALLRRCFSFFRDLFSLIPKRKVSDYENFYNMNHKRRGIALIFNTENFKAADNKKRTGSIKDRDDLAKVLCALEFDVEVFNDLTFKAMEKELKKARRKCHKDNDCLLMTIMSHGDLGAISSYDEDYALEDVTSFFTDENCPSLQGKPRLFLVQACREIIGRANHITNFSANTSDANPFNDKDGTFKINRDGNNNDFLIIRSAMPGFVSYRNTTDGSWFIQELCKNLQAYGTTEELSTLLKRVNRRLSEREFNHLGGEQRKDILSITNSLTKFLMFNQKNSK